MRLALACLSCCLLTSLHAAQAPGVAVVELFTSEGCSSCPGADKVINQFVTQARAQQAPAYALAFHVDYWDTLQTAHGAWKDPFSDAAYTAYQTAYVNALPPMMQGRKIRFTPCILINGRSYRNHEGGFQGMLTQALSTKVACKVALECSRAENGALTVGYTIKKCPEKVRLNLALVERGLVSEVTAGENHGKTLEHENVVRVFKQLPLEGTGTVTGSAEIAVPEGVDADQSSIIAYVQQVDDMGILGATRVDVSSITAKLGGAMCEGGVCIMPEDQETVAEEVAAAE